MRNKEQSGKQKNRALRLTFSYVGSGVQLIARQSLEMTPLPSDPLNAREGETGFWYEIRDANGHPIYRRITENPLRFAVEIRTDDPSQPLTWQKVSQPQGQFLLLLPDLDQAQTLVLFSSPPEPEGGTKPSQEIARFDLRQSRTR